MDLNLEKITFIIVTYNSDNVIKDCLNSLPKKASKIIIENSFNEELKKDLENNYDNIKVILSENKGMGTSNNLGIKMCKTQYAYILNPDIILKENAFDKICQSLNALDDFAIASPVNCDLNFPNYRLNKNNLKKENLWEVESVDGFSMIINKKKFKDNEFFDENFFLFLENDDLCLRVRKKNDLIYVIRDAFIDHKGFSSVSKVDVKELEYLRNWHWMWSKFYFNKKNFGFFNALIKVSLNLLSACFKYLIYLLIFNSHKKKVYQMRLLGILNSILGKKSWYRIKD